MIPRSQTQVRLSYGDRCAVDIYFLEVRSAVHQAKWPCPNAVRSLTLLGFVVVIQNHSVKMQTSSGGVRVPSCPSEKGIVMDCQNFADKLRSTLSEMASA